MRLLCLMLIRCSGLRNDHILSPVRMPPFPYGTHLQRFFRSPHSLRALRKKLRHALAHRDDSPVG